MKNTGWVILSLFLLTAAVGAIGLYLAPSAKEMGMMEIKGGQYREAFKFYLATYTKGDHSINVLFPLMGLYVYYGNVDKAIAILEPYVAENPHSIEGRKKLAELYKASQRFYSYCRTLEELQELVPSMQNLRELADTYDFIGSYDKELPALAHLVEQRNYKSQAEDYVKLASLYRLNNEPSKGIKIIDAYIEKHKYNVSMDIVQLSLQLLLEAGDGHKALSIAGNYLSKNNTESNAITFSELFLEAGKSDESYVLLRPFLPHVEHSPLLLKQLVNVQLARGKKKEIYSLLADEHKKSILPEEFFSTLIDLSIDFRNYVLAETLLRQALLHEIPQEALIRYASFAWQVKRPDIARTIKGKLSEEYLQHSPLLSAMLSVAISDTPQTMEKFFTLPQSAIALPEQKMMVADIFLQHNYTKRAFQLFDTMPMADILNAMNAEEFVRVYLDAGQADKGKRILEAAQHTKNLVSRVNVSHATVLFAVGEGRLNAVQQWLKSDYNTDDTLLADANNLSQYYHHYDVTLLVARRLYHKNPTSANRLELGRALAMTNRYTEALEYLQHFTATDANARSLYIDIMSNLIHNAALAGGVPEPYRKALNTFAASEMQRNNITYEEKLNLVYMFEEAGDKEQAQNILFTLAASQPFDSPDIKELLSLWGDRPPLPALSWLESRAFNAPMPEKQPWITYLNDTGNAQSVINVLKQTPDLSPPLVDEYIRALVAAHMKKELEPILAKQIAQESQPERLEKLSDTAQQENLSAVSEKGWRKLHALDPDNSEALKQIGLLDYNTSHYSEAQQMLGEYLQDNDGDYDVNYAYADTLQHLSRTDESKAYFAHAQQQVAEVNYKDINTLMTQADLLYRNNHVEESLTLYRELLSKHPKNKTLKADFARALIETKHFKEASAVLSQE